MIPSSDVIAKLERLAAAGIQLVPVLEIPTHFVLARGEYAALVERTDDGFGATGSAGFLSDAGFAALVWQGDAAWFVRKGFRQPASAEQVAALRRFAADLAAALSTCSAP